MLLTFSAHKWFYLILGHWMSLPLGPKQSQLRPNGPLIELAWLYLKPTQLWPNYDQLKQPITRLEFYIVRHVIGSSNASSDPLAYRPLFRAIAQSAYWPFTTSNLLGAMFNPSAWCPNSWHKVLLPAHRLILRSMFNLLTCLLQPNVWFFCFNRFIFLWLKIILHHSNVH